MVQQAVSSITVFINPMAHQINNILVISMELQDQSVIATLDHMQVAGHQVKILALTSTNYLLAALVHHKIPILEGMQVLLHIIKTNLD